MMVLNAVCLTIGAVIAGSWLWEHGAWQAVQIALGVLAVLGLLVWKLRYVVLFFWLRSRGSRP